MNRTFPKENKKKLNEEIRDLKALLKKKDKEIKFLKNELENLIKPIRVRKNPPEEVSEDIWRRNFIKRFKKEVLGEE